MPAPYTSSMDGYGLRAAEQQQDRRTAAVVDVKLLDGAVEKVGGALASAASTAGPTVKASREAA